MIRLKSLLSEGNALTSDFLSKIMQWENSIKAGWNAKKKRWFPHVSVEGGTGTIAYGHKLTARDIQSGRFTNGITESEAIELLKNDLYAASTVAKQLVPDYKSLPDNVRQALINAAFRGEIKSTHNTIKLMNSDKWLSAAKEYLNNDEYRTRPGVQNRMNWNYEQFLSMGKNKSKSSDNSKNTNATSSKTHIVKSGDSLSVIAAKYKTTVSAIKKANKLEGDTIKPGQKLVVK